MAARQKIWWAEKQLCRRHFSTILCRITIWNHNFYVFFEQKPWLPLSHIFTWNSMLQSHVLLGGRSCTIRNCKYLDPPMKLLGQMVISFLGDIFPSIDVLRSWTPWYQLLGSNVRKSKLLEKHWGREVSCHTSSSSKFTHELIAILLQDFWFLILLSRKTSNESCSLDFHTTIICW